MIRAFQARNPWSVQIPSEEDLHPARPPKPKLCCPLERFVSIAHFRLVSRSMVPGAIELAWGADVYFADRDIHPDEFLPTATRADSSLINSSAPSGLIPARKRIARLVEDMKGSLIHMQGQDALRSTGEGSGNPTGQHSEVPRREV